MDNLYDKKYIYFNLFNRIQKKYSSYEGLLIMKNQYFTNNIFYYFLSLFFRFIHLIIFCGDYYNALNESNMPFKQYIKIFTCYKLLQQFHITFRIYVILDLIIIIFFIIRIIIIIYTFKRFNNYKYSNKWPLPNNLQIILDHLLIILFPFINEYLSFIYYLYFCPNNFIFKSEISNKIGLILIGILNAILIIENNIENFFNIICSNKIFTTTIFEIYSNLKLNSIKNNKPITYKFQNLIIIIVIFLQNFVLILNLENFLNFYYKIIFKAIISIALLLNIFFIFFIQINQFNYSNFINTSFNIIILFCFYSIIIDFIIFMSDYKIRKILYEIIYILFKLILSYITFLSFTIKTNSFLESKITKILFEDKTIKNEKYFINTFYYLHQIMIKIKRDNNMNYALILINILNRHINKCNKTICNCKLFENFIKIKDNNRINTIRVKKYLPELLIILNYLFELSFIDFDIYKSYYLSILLAEHFCHLKNNSTMAFSLITTFITKQKNKLNKFQLIFLYELSQKYIYHIIAKVVYDINLDNNKNNEELIINKKRFGFSRYYIILNIIYKVKKLMSNYICNEIKILKYKYIFEDLLSFKQDNNENIISIEINFFNETTQIDNLYSINNNMRDKNKKIKKHSNLFNIIYLLKNEHLFYENIINSINELSIMEEIPIFILFKFFLFFDFFEGGAFPEQIRNILYKLSGKKIIMME